MYNQYSQFNPYNPYLRQQTYQPIETPIQQQTTPIMTQNRQNNLIGKQVESIEVVKATDITLDGVVNYFPLLDGSAIITKQLQQDGTSKMVVYKPTKEDNKEVKYATIDDVKKIINDLDIEDLKDEIIGLKKKLKGKKEE